MKKIFLLATSLTLFPLLALAQDAYDIYYTLLSLALKIIQVVFIFIVAVFFWGIAVFIRNAGNEKKLQEAKHWIVWAVVAMFVAISLLGILGFIQRSTGIQPIVIPPLQGQQI